MGKKENWLFFFAAIGAIAAVAKILEFFGVDFKRAAPAIPGGAQPVPIVHSYGDLAWAVALVLCSVVVYVWGIMLVKKGNRALRAEVARLEADLSRSVKVVPELLSEIRFDYLPVSPLLNGWQLANEERPTSEPNFSSLPTGSPVAAGLTVTPTGWYGMDHSVPFDGRTCNLLQLSARFSDSGRLYVFVEVSSRDAVSVTDRKWLQFVPSDFADKPVGSKTGQEWVVTIVGGKLGNNWRSYDISLPEKVRDAIGNQGLVYKQILTVRLRGELSISGIRFSKGPDGSHTALLASPIPVPISPRI